MVADEQTIKDLEFNTVREWLKEFTVGPTAEGRCTSLSPVSNQKQLKKDLFITQELLHIKQEGETFPAIQFEELNQELRMLPIENAVISLEGFMRIYRASVLCNELLHFFDKRDDDYPLLCDLVNNVYYTKEVIELIEKVFDKFGNVKDDASETLFGIRSRVKVVIKEVNKNFDREARKLRRLNMLGDTTETFIENRRVLTVVSSHKKKVGGNILGSSNTGNLTYIEPDANAALNQELDALRYEENKEIERILRILRKDLFMYFELIKGYQSLLTEIDFINAKARLAFRQEAILPGIEEETILELTDAFHPILQHNNNKLGKKTIPQQLFLDKFHRMLVISGPNAGGKSITLKTIGLFQLMLQSGLLIPANENSRMCIFNKICSDIGDNQSIANELSTYSYRLKRMKTFIDLADRKTMFLLDEFGTGSDPDLGGALAEAIFERLYNKKSFAVITTHYSNIKLKADKLKNAFNGSMLFNTDTLEPTYIFNPGQPGSSFTFEVAKINGIPDEIIEAAKEKLDEQKVRMDKLLSELQKERHYYSRLKEEYAEAQQNAEEAIESSKETKEYYEEKLASIRSNADKNNKYIQLGKKMQGFIDGYILNSRKKTVNDKLVSEVKKFLAVEKSKVETVKQEAKRAKAQSSKKPKVKKYAPKKDEHQRDKIKVGSRVRMIATRQIGTVEEIDKSNVTVSFGFARMKVDLSKLSWVD
ncbi:MAG: endonuclease MutS2 [Crocinitomicaceae bacterium]